MLARRPCRGYTWQVTLKRIGRYEIKGEIGRGISTVYRAFDTGFNREVAVKVLPLELSQNLNFRARFKRELKTIASLEHPAIVPVYDVGEVNGQPFFVMRYMAGGSLATLIEQGRFSLQDTARIIERVALALDHAHKRGIIHRDMKPDNILFDANDNPYISDFGVAKLTESGYSSTQEGRMIGTPGYMSPEQAYNKSVDGRSDIYGLGAIIYQMLSGKKPYHHKTDAPISAVIKHLTEPLPEILRDAPNMPQEVDTIIKTAMAKNKEDRYASAIDLARALNKVAFGEDRILNAPSTILDRPGFMASTRSRLRWLAGGIVILGLIGLFAFRNQLPFLSPASLPTASLTPSYTASASTATASPAPAFTATIEPTVSTPLPTVNPYPGSADLVALVSGNDLYLMNTDGSNLVQVRTDNASKSNLQWITGNRLVYMSRNCAYLMDGNTKQTQPLSCFNAGELLESFHVSPDGKYVAISIQKTLNILPFNIDVLKEVDSRFDLLKMQDNCFYNQYPFREVLWSKDGTHLAARVIDTRLVNSDQIFYLNVDIPNCDTVGPVRLDRIPGGRIEYVGESTKRIGSFDWDGEHLFLLNDFIRNDGFGNLYLYDSNTREATKLNPINGECCYRDARLSPDGKYIFFVYQRFGSNVIELYYVSFSDLQSGQPLTPIELPSGFFATARERPQPALRPAE